MTATVESETKATVHARLLGTTTPPNLVDFEKLRPLVEARLLDEAFGGRAHFHHDLADDGALTSSLVVDRFVEVKE